MKFITFLLTMGITLLFLQTNQVLGQQETGVIATTTTPTLSEPVKDQVKNAASEQITAQTFPVDATLLTTIAGTIGGLLWKDRKDKKDVEGQLKEAVDVLMVLNASYIKFFNACMLYPEKLPKQILQLKSANNALEDSTLAAEMANGITRYQKFAVGNFQLQAPNMTTPSPQVVNATTVIPENRVAVGTQQQPPNTTSTTVQTTQQTNTTSNETNQTGTDQTQATAGNTG